MTTANSTEHLPAGSPAPGTSLLYSPGPAFRRYKLTYVLAIAGIASVWGGITGVLLPLQIQDIEFSSIFGSSTGIDLVELTNLKSAIEAGTATATPAQQQQLDLLSRYEASRASALAVISALSIAVGMFVLPIVGAFSDRTTSALGRRAPWILTGAVLGAALLLAARYSPTIGTLLVVYTASQVALNFAPGVLNATVPDRVPAHKIGSMSGLAGLGLLAGGTLGSIVAGSLFARLGLDAYYPFILAAAILPILFVVVSRDRSSKDLQVPAMKWKPFLLSFTIAVRDHDFRWLFIAKILMYFAYAISNVFAIYMLQSYVQPALSEEEAAKMIPLLALAGLPGIVLSLLVAGWWSDRIGRRKPFVMGASIVFALSMIVPFLSPTLPALFIQAVLGSVAIGTFLTVDQAYFIDLLPDPGAPARDLGVSAFGNNIGQAAGPAVAGIVVAVSGGYQMVWLLAIVAAVISMLAILPIRKRDVPSAPVHVGLLA